MADTTDKLVEYMIALNADADLLAKHNANPKQAAEDFGLNPTDVGLIVDQKYDEIKARFDAIDGAKSEIVITFHTPG